MLTTYPSLLRPTSVETVSSVDRPIGIAKVRVQFRRWQGTLPSDTFGGKPFIDFGGRPIFAELCVYELFRLSGWDARWVETFGAPASRPNLFTGWQEVPRKQQLSRPLSDAAVSEMLETVAKYNGGGYAGCWDVVGWHKGKIVFAELKRRRQDQIRETQIGWLEAGLQAGLQPEDFLLVEWDFLEE